MDLFRRKNNVKDKDDLDENDDDDFEKTKLQLRKKAVTRLNGVLDSEIPLNENDIHLFNSIMKTNPKGSSYRYREPFTITKSSIISPCCCITSTILVIMLSFLFLTIYSIQKIKNYSL